MCPRCVQVIFLLVGDLLGLLCAWPMSAAAPEDELCIFMSPTDLAIQACRLSAVAAAATPQVTLVRSADLASKGEMLGDTRHTHETRRPEAAVFQVSLTLESRGGGGGGV